MNVSIDRQRAMERRDFDYYEARARDVKLEDITSCDGNAEILQQLRDPDTSFYTLRITDDDIADDDYFVVSEGDDLGWLGYFIGKSKYLEDLLIYSWGEGENIEAFMEGINHNESIDLFHIGTDLRGVSFRNLGPFFRNNNSLVQLEISFEVGLECAQSIAFVLGESQYHSLAHIHVEGCHLSDEGFAVIATALGFQPQLERLRLERNNIGLMGCTALGATLRGWGTSNLTILDLDNNPIDDQGLQELVAGITNAKLEELWLSGTLITGAGLRSLSTYLQSESCCLRTLDLTRVDFGDEGAMVLADGLRGNKSLNSLYFDPDDSGITDDGWAAFSKLLCDPTSINSTYLSNHKIKRIGEPVMLRTPLNIRRYLGLNEHLGRRHAAMKKILKSHPDLEMEPFFQLKLKLLPVVVNWFRSARSRWANDLGESIQRGSLPSRELSALYKFVRGMPAFAVTSYCQQLVMNAQAKRRRIDYELRRLEDERQRLEDDRRRLDGERCRLDYDEEAAWVILGGRPTSEGEGSGDFVSGSKRRRQE
ncbi:leucine-rich repeat protein [Skeletonema marinoi]|uniref:Leucine-rich repeat protein n=1 Tax=Skeletonema marinoi TaxID=267567 RepID=A0AAD8XU66_9STRA|nr:leucine-rich repeat protein [Skeletonema marinoi]